MSDRKLRGVLSSRPMRIAAVLATLAVLALAGSAAGCWASGTVGPQSSLLLALTVPVLKQN